MIRNVPNIFVVFQEKPKLSRSTGRVPTLLSPNVYMQDCTDEIYKIIAKQLYTTTKQNDDRLHSWYVPVVRDLTCKVPSRPVSCVL